jgi:Tol biopolymer transport system component
MCSLTLLGLALLALATPAHAAFPGENGKIAYNRFSCNQICTDIFTVNEDGTGRTQLTSGTARNTSPAWSADGLKIAFTTNRDEPNPNSCVPSCNYEIYSMNADGTGQVRLTVNSASDTGPAWSPDGSKIAFTSSRSPRGIYVMNSDGSDQRLLLAAASDPAWSPDGTKIAYTGPGGTSDQPQQDIWVMDADGTNQRRITQSGDIEYPCGSDYFTYDESDFAPDWSPDGTKLTYGEDLLDECGDGFAAYAVETVDASGTGPERTIFSSYEGCAFPSAAWSPDGSKIAFTYCYLNEVDPDGSGSRIIDSNCCGISQPDWQPVPNRPPDCSSVAASRTVLTTVNRRLVAITLDGATDPDGDSLTLSVDGVKQDEPVSSSGDPTSPDAIDEGEGELRVRAERNPRGDGRVYRIAFTASDGRGGSCSGTATVSVPRKKRKPAVDSAPPSFDSLTR